ncbi:MAG TPA: hypothetical protein VH760_00890 [Gaiellaceae bacterium]|jgi:hypothetical protein
MKRWVTLAGLAAAVLLAAGCGSSDVANVPDSVAPGSARFLASAATRSTATPSMKTDLIVTMLSSQLPGGRMELSATGALDNENHRMSMRLDMSKLLAQLGTAMPGAAMGSAADWVGQEVADFSNGQAVMYLNMPVLAKVLPGGKPWIKVDLSAVGKQAGIDLSQFTQLGTDPSRMVDWLRTVSGDVTTVGTEQIDGVETTHYRATVDLSKYPDLVPADQREAVRKALDQLTKTAHLSSFPVHVWVGKDGLVRQVRAVLTETIQGQTMNVMTTERFYDFGAPVDIQLPSDDQVTDISSMAGAAAG